MKHPFLQSVACGFPALAFCLSASAWSIDGSGVATVESDETKEITNVQTQLTDAGVKKIKLKGTIDFADGLELADYVIQEGGVTKCQNLTVNGNFIGENGSPHLLLHDGGTLKILGNLQCAGGNGWFQIDSGSDGTLELHGTNNQYHHLRFRASNLIRCAAENVLYSTAASANAGSGALCFNGGSGAGYGVDLQGYSQRVRRLDVADLTATSGSTGEAHVWSASEATFTVDEISNSSVEHYNDKNFPLRLSGAASFCYNAAERFNLASAKSDTTGDLVVSNGTLGLKWNYVWGGRKVLVSGGTLQVDTANAFTNELLNLVVEADGVLVLNEPIQVKEGRIGETTLEAGEEYGAKDFPGLVTGAGSIIVLRGADPVSTTHVWTGAAGNDLATAGNWQGDDAPNLTDGGATLVFSAGSATANASAAAAVNALTFRDDASFALTGEQLTLNGAVTTENTQPAPAEKITFTVSNPLRIRSSYGADWAVGAETLLALEGPIAGPLGRAITVSGEGEVRLSGDNSEFGRPLVFQNAKVYVNGADALGSNSRTVTFASGTDVLFESLTNNAPIAVPSGFSTSQASVSSYVGADRLTFAGYVDAGGAQNWFMDRQDMLGGFKTTAALNVYFIDGQEHTFGGPLNAEGVFANVIVSGGSTLHLALDGANSTYNTFHIRAYGPSCGHVCCEKADVFRPTAPLSMANYSTGKPEGVGLDLNGFSQTVNTVVLDNFGHAADISKGVEQHSFITSATPASITFSGVPATYRGTTWVSGFSPTNALAFRGQAGLVFSQTSPAGMDLEYCLVNVKSDTTGPLVVNSGRLVFDWGAGWTATTNVTINGGVLRIAKESEACAFGPSAGRSEAFLRIAGEGRLELDDTVVTTVKALSVADGEFVKAGVYGGPEAGLDAAHTLAQLAGKGRLAVRTRVPAACC